MSGGCEGACVGALTRAQLSNNHTDVAARNTQTDICQPCRGTTDSAVSVMG